MSKRNGSNVKAQPSADSTGVTVEVGDVVCTTCSYGGDRGGTVLHVYGKLVVFVMTTGEVDSHYAEDLIVVAKGKGTTVPSGTPGTSTTVEPVAPKPASTQATDYNNDANGLPINVGDLIVCDNGDVGRVTVIDNGSLLYQMLYNGHHNERPEERQIEPTRAAQVTVIETAPDDGDDAEAQRRKAVAA